MEMKWAPGQLIPSERGAALLDFFVRHLFLHVVIRCHLLAVLLQLGANGLHCFSCAGVTCIAFVD